MWLTLIIFLPAIAAALIGLLVPKTSREGSLWIALGTSLVVMVMVLAMLFRGTPGPTFDISQSEVQSEVIRSWIPTFDIEYFLALDGISFPLVVLTAVISVLAMVASWSITKQVKGYCILFLLLMTGMLGVFMALDFFLFYVFWEVMLLPMYFLIGIWGGPRKEYAAIKFFLYTLLGSVFMLIAILILYFASDLTALNVDQLARARVIRATESVTLQQAHDQLMRQIQGEEVVLSDGQVLTARSKHTFNILALSEMGQHTTLFDGKLAGLTLQHWAFLLLFVGFIIKVPSVPVHTWLPDAHVEAPTPISMILAGILLKMGGYGILRICYPICPHAGYDFAWGVCLIGVVSMVYGAFAAMAQKDFKRLVAYSSVSHMGYVVLGLGVWSAARGTGYDPQYWIMGVKGAMYQMIAHGVSSAGMFFMVGVIYDRVHHRELDRFGGLYGRMPVYTALAIGLFFAGLGLPGLCGFIGEVFVVLSVWRFDIWLAVISASVVILTASYILWAIQRVYLGSEYRGPHEEALAPITARELSVAVPLFVMAIWFGVAPQSALRYMDATIDAQVTRIAQLTSKYEKPAVAREQTPDGPADAEQAARQPMTEPTDRQAAKPALVPVSRRERPPQNNRSADLVLPDASKDGYSAVLP